MAEHTQSIVNRTSNCLVVSKASRWFQLVLFYRKTGDEISTILELFCLHNWITFFMLLAPRAFKVWKANTAFGQDTKSMAVGGSSNNISSYYISYQKETLTKYFKQSVRIKRSHKSEQSNRNSKKRK